MMTEDEMIALIAAWEDALMQQRIWFYQLFLALGPFDR